MLELVERAIEGLVDGSELVLEPLHLRFVLELRLLHIADLVFQLDKVGLPTLDILLALHQEKFLFFVVLSDGLLQGVFAVFQHLNHELELLVQLGDGVFLFLL